MRFPAFWESCVNRLVNEDRKGYTFLTYWLVHAKDCGCTPVCHTRFSETTLKILGVFHVNVHEHQGQQPFLTHACPAICMQPPYKVLLVLLSHSQLVAGLVEHILRSI